MSEIIFYPELSAPFLFPGSNHDLNLESTLGDLPLYDCVVPSISLCTDVAHILEENPLLPGVIIVDKQNFVGMISRYRLFEYLTHAQGLELFGQKPIKLLYGYARTRMLILTEKTPILVATPQSLRRYPEIRHEPIIVKREPTTYLLLDVQELNIAYWQIRGIETQVRYERTHAQMIQSEKMASLGRLVDGVAHEILDPVGFIWGNLSYVVNYTKNLLELVSAYESHLSEPPLDVQELSKALELDFVRQDLPNTIASIKSGAERLNSLAKSLQNFCHIDEVYPKPADLHTCLDSIILLLKSRISGEIDITRNYGNLPPINCFIGQLNQVFMNILTNAIDALINTAVSREFAKNFKGETNNQALKPTIIITTQVITLPGSEDNLQERWVSIVIADNGPGISPEKQQQIWESFSTEKRTDKETSLAVSYQIVTGKHGGKFNFRSQRSTPALSPHISAINSLDEGTEFEILLPLA